MLERFPLAVFIGTILGFLAGLGVGGGSLLVLWLTLVLGIDPAQARIANLLFFLPSALIASVFRWKQGSLPIKKLIPAIAAGCITAGLCSWFSPQWDTDLLKKLFGWLLIITGFRELTFRPKKKEP